MMRPGDPYNYDGDWPRSGSGAYGEPYKPPTSEQRARIDQQRQQLGLPPIRVGEVPPPSQTDWGLVAITGVALAATVAGFWWMIQNAGRAA